MEMQFFDKTYRYNGGSMFNIHDFFLTIYRSPLSRIRYWIVVLFFTWCVFSLIFSLIRILRISWSILNCGACIIGFYIIFWITVLRRSPSERIIYAVPFYAFYLARQQREMYREMLMNVFLFVPVGLTLPYFVEMVSALIGKHQKQEANKPNALASHKKGTGEYDSQGSRYSDKKGGKLVQARLSFVNGLTVLDGGLFIGRLKIIGFSILFAAAFSFCIEFLQALFALGTAEVDDVIMNTLGAVIGCLPFLVRLGGIKHS